MPINNPRFVNNSWLRNCDHITLDFEDSVPQSQKPYARIIAREAIGLASQGGAAINIRINQGFIEADVTAAAWPGLSSLSMGHTWSASEIRLMDQYITNMEHIRGLRPGSIALGAACDSPVGTVQSEEIVQASPRVKNFGGGGGYDYSMQLGVDMFVGFDQFVYPRGEGALIARAFGKGFGIGVHLPDTSGSVADAERAYVQAAANRKAGGRGGGGLHPNVVEPMIRGLTPPPEEVEQAQRVLAFYKEQVEAKEETEGDLHGQTVDKYEAARAAELIEWAQACAEMNERKERARREAIARQEAAHTNPGQPTTA
jgi:citrate lyase subunit beta/citryl-CoA lyase